MHSGGWNDPKMPRYYIMDLDKGMAETVASEMPSAAEIAACRWLPDRELRVYSEEYERTGFQGGLQSYRGGGRYASETQLFAGRTIDQPSLFIAGRADWGAYQSPGALERMQKTTIYRYTLLEEGFEYLGDPGTYLRREAVRPLAVEPMGDLLAALAAANIELRVVPSLLPLRGVWDTSLHASGIRLRNARGWEAMRSSEARGPSSRRHDRRHYLPVDHFLVRTQHVG